MNLLIVITLHPGFKKVAKGDSGVLKQQALLLPNIWLNFSGSSETTTMTTTDTAVLQVSSPAFENEGSIPAPYTCDGDGINPPLSIGEWPKDTQTLAIIAEDPDAPNGVFDHWVIWNITPTHEITENFLQGVTGINGAGKTGYHPPCPPSGTHRYIFTVYALDKTLSLVAGEDKKALQERIQKNILAKGTIMGRYQKKQQPSR